MEWKPISEAQVLDLINESRKCMNPLERRFWDAISFHPEKWQQHPYGASGSGFWAVAVIGRTVVWYNDIEHGFNRSQYLKFGQIPQDGYWCNQDDLEVQIKQLMDFVATGRDAAGRFGPPQAGEYPSR